MRPIDADALKRQYEDRKRLFCRNRIEFSTLSDKDKARVDELDNCIADTLNAPTIEPDWTELMTICDNCGHAIHIKRTDVQPTIKTEIVQCRDCMHGVDYYHDGDCYCSNPKWGLMYFGGSWEFYCADAERRTDETD